MWTDVSVEHITSIFRRNHAAGGEPHRITLRCIPEDDTFRTTAVRISRSPWGLVYFLVSLFPDSYSGQWYRGTVQAWPREWLQAFQRGPLDQVKIVGVLEYVYRWTSFQIRMVCCRVLRGMAQIARRRWTAETPLPMIACIFSEIVIWCIDLLDMSQWVDYRGKR
jgi:hypothetical protein